LKTKWNKEDKCKEAAHNKMWNNMGIAAVLDDPESEGTAKYLKKIAAISGIKATIGDISDLEFHYSQDCGEVIPIFRNAVEGDGHLLKMYPFEWIATEVAHDELLAHDLEEIDTLEPAWKLIIGNKAILPLLWEMFPNHPNLLPPTLSILESSFKGTLSSYPNQTQRQRRIMKI